LQTLLNPLTHEKTARGTINNNAFQQLRQTLKNLTDAVAAALLQQAVLQAHAAIYRSYADTAKIRRIAKTSSTCFLFILIISSHLIVILS
jgi:hypothetical protein